MGEIRRNRFGSCIVTATMIWILIFGLAGCGSSGDTETGEPTAPEALYAVVQLAVESVEAGKASALDDFAAGDVTAKTESREKEKAASQEGSTAKNASGSTTAKSGKTTAAASTGQSSGSTDTTSSESYGKGTPTSQQKSAGKATGQTAHSCTISVECGTVFNHMDDLTAGKADLIPAGGVILPDTTVTFSEGDTVFDVLKNTLRKEGILFEFETTPVYNGAYIEGIANLYEFDCGPLSGWMYAVNGSFPNYGCSSCKVKNGDSIDWIYTCDLGRDIGGGDAGGQRER